MSAVLATTFMAQLPDDVLIPILKLVASKDLASCKQVSRYFKDVIASNVQLQYRLELEVAAMSEGNTFDLNTAYSQRLAQLRSYRSIFGQRTLKVERTQYIAFVKTGRVGAYAAAGGVFAKQTFFPDWRAIVEITDCRVSNTARYSWPSPTLFPFDAMALKPSENALFAVETPQRYTLHKSTSLHVFQISDGAYHPNSGRYFSLFSGEYGLARASIQISGDITAVYLHISLFVALRSERIIIMNWKTGDMTHVFEDDTLTLQGNWCLLSPTVFICLGRETRGEVDQPYIAVHKIQEPEENRVMTLPIWIADFNLPTVERCGDPNQFKSTLLAHFPSDLDWRTLEHDQFTIQPGIKLIGLTLGVTNSRGTVPGDVRPQAMEYNFLIRADTFMRTHRFLSGTRSGRGANVIPWDVWGPSQTRCFPNTGQVQAPLIHGWMVAFRNTILNFNPGEIHSRTQTKTTGPQSSALDSKPTTIPRLESYFSQPVTTGLPYMKCDIEWTLPMKPQFFWGRHLGYFGANKMVRRDGSEVIQETFKMYSIPQTPQTPVPVVHRSPTDKGILERVFALFPLFSATA